MFKESVLILLILIIFTGMFAFTARADEYHLHIDDRLFISVWGHSDLQQETPVDPDGMISFPLIGKVKATGMTREELKREITDKLSEYIKDPRVSISIIKYRQSSVIVMGEVKAPGTYRLEENDRILDLLSRAGGLTENANASSLRLLRDQEIITVNLSDLFAEDGKVNDNNYLLRNGDTLFVPESSIEVTILGAVEKPGHYQLEKGLYLRNLLARAGSLTENAAREATYISEGEVIKIDLDRLLAGDIDENPVLSAGDSIYIPETTYQITILGEVKTPGAYNWNNNLRLTDLLALAGSQTERGDIENIKITHKDGSAESINLKKYFTEHKIAANPALSPGDIVLVEELATSPRIAILGEVNNPGAYNWDKDINLADLLARAGNPTERGDITEVKILHNNGEYEEIDLERYLQGEHGFNPQLKPGDIVLVGEKDSIDWKEFFTYITGLNALKTFLDISW